MTTDTQTEVNQKPAVTIEEIWNNLVVTDQQENHFQFAACRNRHIVVIGSPKTKSYIVGDIIRRDTYSQSFVLSRKEEQKTITYVMIQDDRTCNVCVINLIDIPSLDYFIKRAEKNTKGTTPSPMVEIDKTIYKYATYIDLIILVCEGNDFESIKNMTKWASKRGHIMALAFIVNPLLTSELREEYLLSVRENPKFKKYNSGDLFEKGMFCISDLSYNHFRDNEEQIMAQNHVKEWRSKFLRVCVGGPNDKKYAITSHDEDQSRNTSRCNIS